MVNDKARDAVHIDGDFILVQTESCPCDRQEGAPLRRPDTWVHIVDIWKYKVVNGDMVIGETASLEPNSFMSYNEHA